MLPVRQSRDKFGYLTAEQALADYADNVQWLRQQLAAADTPVIVFGGSYGGMLAAWFRIKYPHLAIGALASSAPVWHFPGIVDCHGYYSIATQDFADYSPSCADAVRNSWKVLRQRASTAEGRAWLSRRFSLCPGEELSAQSVDRLVTWISAAYEYMAMTDYPNAATFLQPMPAYPIRVGAAAAAAAVQLSCRCCCCSSLDLTCFPSLPLSTAGSVQTLDESSCGSRSTFDGRFWSSFRLLQLLRLACLPLSGPE